MAEAFVYCWTDHKTNKIYIGSHKGDVNDGYVCSSKYMMEEYDNVHYKLRAKHNGWEYISW